MGVWPHRMLRIPTFGARESAKTWAMGVCLHRMLRIPNIRCMRTGKTWAMGVCLHRMLRIPNIRCMRIGKNMGNGCLSAPNAPNPNIRCTRTGRNMANACVAAPNAPNPFRRRSKAALDEARLVRWRLAICPIPPGIWQTITATARPRLAPGLTCRRASSDCRAGPLRHRRPAARRGCWLSDCCASTARAGRPGRPAPSGRHT
jgi:hypothetical protein